MLLVGVVLGAPACNGGAAVTASAPTPTAAIRLPSKVLGLRVVEEDVSGDFERVRGSYLDSVSLFGFRERGTLRAALEVGHFNSLGRPGEPRFVEDIVAQAGASVPQPLRVGEWIVWTSVGRLHFTFLWFTGRWMYVLTVRRDYTFVRTLLRRLVERAAEA